MQALDGLGPVTASGDVPCVCGVAEHLADGVDAEGSVAGGALLIDVEPLGESAVGVLAGGVHLEDAMHIGRLLGVGLGDPVLVLDVPHGRLPVSSPCRAFSRRPIFVQKESETE